MKTILFLTKHTGQNATTKQDVIAVYNEADHKALLSETTYACWSSDDDRRVSVDAYGTREVSIPDWMDADIYAGNSSLQVSLKWFFGFGGVASWGESWFEKIADLGEASRLAVIRLLKVKKFRSAFRKSLRDQLEKWLNGDSDYGSPFSQKQWDCLIDKWTALSARQISSDLYHS